MSANVKIIYDLLLEARGRNYYLRIGLSEYEEVIILKRYPYIRVFVNIILYSKIYEILRLKDFYRPVAKDRPLSQPFPLKCKGRYYDYEELVSDTSSPEVWVDLAPYDLVISIGTHIRHPPFSFVWINFGQKGEQLVAQFRKTEKGLRPWRAFLVGSIPHYYGPACPVKTLVLGGWQYQFVMGDLSPNKIQAARELLWQELINRFGKDSPQVKEGLIAFAEGILTY